jgi:hypothetical protein
LPTSTEHNGEGKGKFAPARSRGDNADNTVTYLGANLSTDSLEFPKSGMPKLRVLLVIACVIGIGFLVFYFDKAFITPAKEAAAIEEQMSQGVQTITPTLYDYIGLSDEEVMAGLASMGTTLYQIPQDSAEELEVISLPDDVSLTDAAVMYAEGVANLSLTDAFKLLNGSWVFNIDREVSEVLGLHWADFVSGDAETAAYSAAVAQGFDAAAATDSGVDSSGNTFLEGTFTKSGTVYTWRVSVIALSEIYSISGLPDSSLYVGVRISQ